MTPANAQVQFSKEQEAVLWEIAAIGSHMFYSPEFTQRIEKAFGVKVGYFERANTGQPKGLMVAGVGRNAKVYGSSSHDVAKTLCSHLGIKYPTFNGRGSQFYACLELLFEAGGLAAKKADE